jgi:hypothetical protein
MASIYVRRKSPYLWIRFKDEQSQWRDKATSYRKDNLGDMRQAKLFARAMTEKERRRRPITTAEAWNEWVDRWIYDTYAGESKSGTWTRYARGWRKLRAFLAEEHVAFARQLSYRHVEAYINWRRQTACKNTAIQELKLLSQIVKESCRRFGGENPFVRMGLKREDVKDKEIWTDGEIAVVSAAIQNQPHWLRCTFVLGLYQAARLRQIPRLKDIDIERNRITYEMVKGGKSKRFTQPIDIRGKQALVGLIEERKREDPEAVWLCEVPLLASVEWRKFLNTVKLRRLVHHGLRNTWITRACLGGVPLGQAKRFVNHGSTAVHQIYWRLSADDIAEVPAMVSLPEWTT